MRVAALQLAGDLLLKLVYVPSEDNPADAPSRGVVRRWRQRRSCVHVSRKLIDKRVQDFASARKQAAPGIAFRKRMTTIDKKVKQAARTADTHEERSMWRKWLRREPFADTPSESDFSAA